MTDELPIIAAEIAECTKKDSILVKVYEYTSSGWPGSCPHPELKLYWKMDISKGEEVSSYHSNSKNTYWKSYMSAIQECVV